jgi:L-ribulose-5-phosphate 3-epimerase
MAVDIVEFESRHDPSGGEHPAQYVFSTRNRREPVGYSISHTNPGHTPWPSLEESMDLGCRAHDFGTLPIETLASTIAGSDFSFIQLAPGKAIADIDAGPGRFSPGLAEYVARIFRRSGLRIAVLGCYINPVHPDPVERAKGVVRFAEHLRFARDFGCHIVATETGSLNADFSPHPDNKGEEAFVSFVKTMRNLAVEAERSGAMICIEGVARHTIFSPHRMRRALDEIGSPNVQVLLDPVNYLDSDNWRDCDRLIEESFELFGDRIMAIHAKDFVAGPRGPVVAPAGSGMMDYRRLLGLIKARKPYVDIILEDLRPAAMEKARLFISETWESV